MTQDIPLKVSVAASSSRFVAVDSRPRIICITFPQDNLGMS